VTFDTPVDDNDVADFGYVEQQIVRLFPHLRDGAVVLISSQTPVGFTARLRERYRTEHPGKDVGFAYSPENLRLGQAIQVFRQPDRIVAGVSRAEDRAKLEPLFAPFSENVLWMSVESAEMTKHAINAFLATSVAFINEVAVLCEAVGADSREVERGLKSESRIGPRAYLRAGAAFAGGTLARDIRFLGAIGAEHRAPVRLLDAVAASNDDHKRWTERALERELAPLRGKTVAVLGLTYKPGTDTLRRSSSVELCRWLAAQGSAIRAYDPMVKALPPELNGQVNLTDSAPAAVAGADAVVVGTAWPEFRAQALQIAEAMQGAALLDAGGFLEEALGKADSIRYITVGRARRA
jgi:UDPglucose 6-dehydrogenase